MGWEEQEGGTEAETMAENSDDIYTVMYLPDNRTTFVTMTCQLESQKTC